MGGTFGDNPQNILRYERTIFREGMFKKKTYLVERRADGKEYAIAEMVKGKGIPLEKPIPFFILEHKPPPEGIRK